MHTTTSWYQWLDNFGHDHRHNLWCLFALALALIFVGLGLRDPWPADEPRFAQVAIEMVKSGEWFFPTRGGELYPDKPPVFMWSIALFYWLTGSIDFAFLLPSALCALLTVYLVYSLGRQLWSNQIGLYAGLLLLFSLQFTLQAKTAQIDAMVCCWITLGCYGLLRFLLIDGRWRWYFMAWFFMGIGVITKGVGFLPMLMLLPFALLQILKRPNPSAPKIMHAWRYWLGPIVMLAAIALWFVPMLILVEQSQNPLYSGYRDNILFRQTVTRYADSWHHIKPFWYYLVSVVPIFWLPLSLLLPWLLRPWKAAIKKLDYRIILPLAWIVLVLIFFSASPGKRGVYILPALPMLALISAPYVRDILHKRGPQWLVWAVTCCLSLLLFVLAIAGFAEVKATVKLLAEYEVSPWSFLLCVGGIGVMICMLTLKRWRMASWPLFITSLWILYSTWGYALLSPVKTPKAILAAVAEHVNADAQMALVGMSEQFILFSPYPITHFGYHTLLPQQLSLAWQWQGEDANKIIVMDKTEILACYNPDLAIDLGYAHRVNWVLLNTASRLPECPDPRPPALIFSTSHTAVRD
jgi:hypothetical protein